MPYDGVYTILHFTQSRNSVPADYPIAVYPRPAGEQGFYTFHEHDSMELAIVTEGRAQHILNGESADIREGDVLLIPPKVQHAYGKPRTSAPDLGILNILYDPARLPLPLIDGAEIPLFPYFLPSPHAEQHLSPKPVLHLPDPQSLRHIQTLADELNQELTRKLPGNMFGAMVKFLNLILELLRTGNALIRHEKAKSFPLGEALKYIDANFTGDISLDLLARKSFLSKRRFQFRFRQATGYTLTNYVNRRRIALAASLLQERDGDCLAVGALCGYHSGNYFARIFRQIMGVSPRQYQRAAMLHRTTPPAN